MNNGTEKVFCIGVEQKSVGVVQGVRVELEMGGSTGWIESEEVDALVAPLATAAQRKLPTELLCSDEAACAQRCAKAFLAVKVT